MLNRVIYRGAYRFEWRGERWVIRTCIKVIDAIMSVLFAIMIATLM